MHHCVQYYSSDGERTKSEVMRKLLTALTSFLLTLPHMAQAGGQDATFPSTPGIVWNTSTTRSMNATSNQVATVLNADPQKIVATSVNSTLFADPFHGSDCGAKINAALASLAGAPGVVEATPACGTIRTAITLGQNQHLRLRPGTYPISAPIYVGAQAGIECNAIGDAPGSGTGSCYLPETAGANLPVIISLTGNNATLSNVTVDGKQWAVVSAVTLGTSGSGFTSNPVCTLSGGGGTGATCAVFASGGAVTSSLVTNYGHGYTSIPACTISGGGGSGATCVAQIGPNLNPTGGANIAVLGVRSRLDHVTSEEAGTYGVQIGNASNNVAAATKIDHLMALENSSDGVHCQNTSDVYIGVQSEIENNAGNGIKYYNCGASRTEYADISGNLGDGIQISGVATAPVSAYSQTIVGNQFGQNAGNDINIQAWDTAAATYVSLYDVIVGNQFIGSFLHVPNTASAIHVQDGGFNTITGNAISEGEGEAFKFKAGIDLNESAPARELADTVSGNSIQILSTPMVTLASTACGINTENGPPSHFCNLVLNNAQPLYAYSNAGPAGGKRALLDYDAFNVIYMFGDASQQLIAFQPTPGANLLTLNGASKTAVLSGLLIQPIGAAIASNSTISPVAPVVHVTGTTTITTIVAPTGCSTAGQACTVTLIPDGLWGTTTGGNIAVASTAVVGKQLMMIYDPATSLWYPSYTN